MRLAFLTLLLTLTLAAAERHGGENGENPPTGENPTAASHASNLSKALTEAGVNGLFNETEKLGEDMSKLRELSKEQREALGKAFEGAETLSESAKSTKEALEIIGLSDEKLNEEIGKLEKDGEENSAKKEKLVAEAKERMKNAPTKPSVESFRAMQQLKSDPKTKAFSGNIQNYNKLSPKEQEAVRGNLAKVAVENGNTNQAYWNFFGQNSQEAKTSVNRAFESSIDRDLKGYETRYTQPNKTVAVFQDSSGKKFSVNNPENYQKFLSAYQEAKDLAGRREALKLIERDEHTYYEKKGDQTSGFRLDGAYEKGLAYTRNTGKSFSADPTLKEKLQLKSGLDDGDDYEVRLYENKSGKSSVTSHHLTLFDTNIQASGEKSNQSQSAYMQVGYLDGKYFLFSSEESKGTYSNPHALVTDPSNRYEFNFASDNRIYMERASDGADFRMTVNKEAPEKSTITDVQFSTPATTQSYVFYNGNWFYAPAYATVDYTYYYVSSGFSYSCST